MEPAPGNPSSDPSEPPVDPGSDEPMAPEDQPNEHPPAVLPVQEPEIEIAPSGNWTVSAENCEVALALQAIAKARRMSVVLSPGVALLGPVSFRVYDLPFPEAFAAILKAANLVATDEGAVTLVQTAAEVSKIQQDTHKNIDDQVKRDADAKKRFNDEAKQAALPEARIYTLQYLSATDAKDLITPLLTETTGKVVPLGAVDKAYQPSLTDGGADSFAFAAKVMVYDTVAKLDQIGALLKDLDNAPKQVRVEATILTVDLTDDTAFGLDISVVGNIDFASVAAPLLSFADIFDGTLKPETPATANVASLYPASKGQPDPTAKIGVITNDVAIFLQMLDQVVDSTVMARPSVTVLNRQKANVQIVERIAYLSTTQTQTSTTQEVKYLDVGVKLRFRPFISPDNMIRLELSPEVSSARVKDIEAAGGGKATVPDELAQSLMTNIRVKSGQTIVLGGLFRELTDTTNRQVPVLGDIVPGAFSGKASTVKKQEIIFLITPVVVEDAQIYADGANGLRVVDAAKVGARAGLLPFSESHLMGAYQVQALEAWKQGDRSTALYYVDQALRLQATSPLMIELREDIRADDKSRWQVEFDSLLLLPPPIPDDRGFACPPTQEQISKDIPPPVDDDFTRTPPQPMSKEPLP